MWGEEVFLVSVASVFRMGTPTCNTKKCCYYPKLPPAPANSFYISKRTKIISKWLSPKWHSETTRKSRQIRVSFKWLLTCIPVWLWRHKKSQWEMKCTLTMAMNLQNGFALPVLVNWADAKQNLEWVKRRWHGCVIDADDEFSLAYIHTRSMWCGMDCRDACKFLLLLAENIMVWYSYVETNIGTKETGLSVHRNVP